MYQQLKTISKYSLLMLLFFMAMSCTSSAQKDEVLAGVYNISSSDPQGGSAVYMLPGHQFLAIAFGTAIKGTWELKDSTVKFNPQFPEQSFKLYGRHNKKLGNGIRIYFSGFDSDGTIIGFDQAGAVPLMTRVFNPSPNCVPYPSVYQFAKVPQKIHFAAEPGSGTDSVNANTLWDILSFNNAEKCNDFIAEYAKTSSRPRPFSAVIKNGKLYFNDKEARRKPLPASGKEIADIKAFLKEPLNPQKVFYNPYFNQANANVAADTANYHFNPQKDAYISFRNYTEGEENKSVRDGDYNNLNVLYQYNSLSVFKSSSRVNINTKSLFTATCKD